MRRAAAVASGVARRAVAWTPLAGVSLLLACGSQSLIPPALPDQPSLYWSLELNYHAVTLALTGPYDTLSLVATPRNYRDEPLTGLPTPQYVSHDLEHVAVTPEGLLIATGRTNQPVWIYATLTTQNLKHTDSVLVQVVDTATTPVLASLSIHPVPPDSAKISSNGPLHGSLTAPEGPSDTLLARAFDATGGSIPTYPFDNAAMLPLYFRSADTSVATVDRTTGEVSGVRPGQISIYVTTTAFGITKADTLSYRVGERLLGLVRLSTPSDASPIQFSPKGGISLLNPELRIGTGGAVVWVLGGTKVDTVDITFADADLPNVAATAPVIDLLATYNPAVYFLYCLTGCDDDGNFLLLSPSRRRISRYFPVPGTYEYHSTRYNLAGRIIVVDER